MSTTTNTFVPKFIFVLPEKYLPKRPGDNPQESEIKYEVVRTGHHTFVTVKSISFSPAALNYLAWGPMLFAEILQAAKDHYSENANDTFLEKEMV